MTTPRAVIFDLDGTLYDNRPLHWLIPLHEILALRPHYSYRERKARKALYGQQFATSNDFYSRMYALISPGHPDKASDWYLKRYLPLQARLIHHCCRAFPWVKPRLEQLRMQGVKLALYSDYAYAEQKLRALGIDPAMFDVIVEAPSLGGLKPSADAGRQVLQMLGVKAEETLFVGDRDDCDGETARRVGADFRLVTR